MDIDLLSPDVFAGHQFLDRLAAVRDRPGPTRHPEPDGPGFWVAARYDDVQAVLSGPGTSSSRAGIRLQRRTESTFGAARLTRPLFVREEWLESEYFRNHLPLEGTSG